MKALLPIIIFLIGFLNTLAQSMPETIEYINSTINSNKDEHYTHTDYKWSISEDGQLIISEFRNKKVDSECKVYLKALDSKEVYISPNHPGEFGYIQVYCKEKQKCIRGRCMDGYLVILFKNDEIVAKRLKNAIEHLINSAYSETNYRNSDPFDY